LHVHPSGQPAAATSTAASAAAAKIILVVVVVGIVSAAYITPDGGQSSLVQSQSLSV
jgi:hypothetical protein